MSAADEGAKPGEYFAASDANDDARISNRDCFRFRRQKPWFQQHVVDHAAKSEFFRGEPIVERQQKQQPKRRGPVRDLQTAGARGGRRGFAEAEPGENNAN